MHGWLYSLDHTTLGTTIRQSAWLFPLIETFHLFGIVSLVASTSILDLRLLGTVRLHHWPVSKLAGPPPVGVVGPGRAAVTGLLMTSSEAEKNYHNPAFRVKMLLILLAGVNFPLSHENVFQVCRGLGE